MDNKINEFINRWKKRGEVIEEHIDYFMPNKKAFSYDDVRQVIYKINRQNTIDLLDNVDVIAYIECESSKHIQKWGEDFWKLVDYSKTLPSIAIGRNILWSKHDYEEIIIDDLVKEDDYVNIYTSDFDGELYIRRLHIIKKAMVKTNG